jgi:uncharacterized protein (TIGR02284 family)
MTTTTSASSARQALLDAFNACIRAAMNAQKGYAVASGGVREFELKTLFQLRSDERARFVIALQRAVSELGGWPENHGTIEGALHRTWIEARLAIEGRNDVTVLAECERGERAGIVAYERLVWLTASNPALPASMRAMVSRQHEAVGEAIADLAQRQLAPS